MKIRLLRCAGVLLFGLLGFQETASAANGVRCEIQRKHDEPVGGEYKAISKDNHNDEAAVGHYVKLKCAVIVIKTGELNGDQGGNWKWTIPGSPIQGYTFTLPLGKKLAPPPTNEQFINFNWYKDNGTMKLKVKVDVDGKTIKGDSKIELKRPDPRTLTSVTDSVRLTQDGHGAGLLQYGLIPPPGITWTGDATAPVINSPGVLDGRGELIFVQRVISQRDQTLNNGTQQEISTDGKSVLDRKATGASPRYGDISVSIAAGASAQIISEDSPTTGLSSDITFKSINQTFETYLMYRPEGANSIPISLRQLNWRWKASTTRTGTTWSAPSGVSSSSNPGSNDFKDIPEWSTSSGVILGNGYTNK